MGNEAYQKPLVRTHVTWNNIRGKPIKSASIVALRTQKSANSFLEEKDEGDFFFFLLFKKMVVSCRILLPKRVYVSYFALRSLMASSSTCNAYVSIQHTSYSDRCRAHPRWSRWCIQILHRRRMPTYALVCDCIQWHRVYIFPRGSRYICYMRMLTYANVCVGVNMLHAYADAC
jgi:hypothetical protein